MPFWRPVRPLQFAPSPKNVHLQEPREQTVEKLGTDTQEKEVFCCSSSLKSSGQPAFKLDRKHRRFPWLPKNTYQQLPVTAGQIPVSSTISAFLLSPVKNTGGWEGEEKSFSSSNALRSSIPLLFPPRSPTRAFKSWRSPRKPPETGLLLHTAPLQPRQNQPQL